MQEVLVFLAEQKLGQYTEYIDVSASLISLALLFCLLQFFSTMKE